MAHFPRLCLIWGSPLSEALPNNAKYEHFGNGFDPPGQRNTHTTWNGRKHTFISTPTPTPKTQHHCAWPDAHSAQPRGSSEQSPTLQHHRSLKGAPVSTAGGDGEQGPDPKEQQLREVPALAITGPGYRAIAKGRQSQVWAPGLEQLVEVV